MICNNCGKTIRDRSAFCEFCGSKQMVYMPEDATVVQQNNMKYEDPYVQFGEPFYDTTNNYSEAFNHAINRLININHPKLTILVQKMKSYIN